MNAVACRRRRLESFGAFPPGTSDLDNQIAPGENARFSGFVKPSYPPMARVQATKSRYWARPAFGRSQKNASKRRAQISGGSTTRRAGKMADAWLRTATEAWVRTATMEQMTKVERSVRWIDSCCAALQRGAAPRTTVLDSDIEAVTSLQQAADEGLPWAQCVLARLLSSSEGWKNYRLPNIAENDSLAAEYFRKAAEQDVGSAQYELADMYFQGRGLERNMLMAEQWSDKAIEALADVTDEQKRYSSMLNVQAYLLAERLRRVKTPSSTPEALYFPDFKPLPSDEVTQVHKIYTVSCEACSGPVPLNRGKKYCKGCMVVVYCSKACQKADWKRHKKVCGKGSKKDIFHGKDKETYKADLDVTREYYCSVPGLDTFAKALYLIHWNDSPFIRICTREGTDGMNPTLVVIPKSLENCTSNFFKDGPRKDKFLVKFDLRHLGPRSADISVRNFMELELDPFNTNEIKLWLASNRPPRAMRGDYAAWTALQVQSRGLVEHVRKRTTLPTTVDEVAAFHDSHESMMQMSTQDVIANGVWGPPLLVAGLRARANE